MASHLPPGRTGLLHALVVAQWAAIGALIVASFTLDALGHAGADWAADGVALAVYLAARLARSQLRPHSDPKRSAPRSPVPPTDEGDEGDS